MTCEQLLAGLHGWRPGWEVIANGHQLEKQHQRLLRFTENESTVFAQLVSADLRGFQAVPALKELLLQTQLQSAHLGAGAGVLCNGDKAKEGEQSSVLPLPKHMLSITTKRDCSQHGDSVQGRRKRGGTSLPTIPTPYKPNGIQG